MEIMTTWQQIPNVHSPTGSVDSGVGLSPRALTYGACDDISPSSQIFYEVNSPESPTCESGIGRVNVSDFPALLHDTCSEYPEQLTADELDYLCSGVNDYPDCISSSPASSGHPSLDDLEDISQFELKLAEEEAKYLITRRDQITVTYNNKAEAVARVGTNSRKRRLKARQSDLIEAYPGIDPCLIPKKGTAKPRQSKKRLEASDGRSMADKNMKPPKMYYGARVKKTARDRLKEIRNEGSSMKQNPSNSIHMTSSQRAGAIMKIEGHGTPGIAGMPSYTSSIQNMGMTGKPMNAIQIPKPPPYISHSVEEILSPQNVNFNPHIQQRGDLCAVRTDSLDQVVNASLRSGDIQGVVEYIQQRKTSNGQNPLHVIVNKQNQKLEQFSAIQIKKVTEQVCRMLPGDINATDFSGETPVYQAALYGNVGSLQALMEAGADPWIQENSGGETALHAAIRSKSAESVGTILQKVSVQHINIAACDGNTPLHKATALRDIDLEKQKKIVQDLLNAGADPSRKNHTNEMAHQLLPPGLKELQEQMKRIKDRRRSHASQHHHQQMQAKPPHFVPPYQPQYPNYATSFLAAQPMPYPFAFQNPPFFHSGLQQSVTPNFTPQFSPYAPPIGYSHRQPYNPQARPSDSDINEIDELLEDIWKPNEAGDRLQ